MKHYAGHRTRQCLVLCLLALPLAAQQEVRISSGTYQLPVTRIVANTDVVSVDVVVRQPDGTPVAGLTRDDFRVLDNGKPRPISEFSVNTATAPARSPADQASPAPAGDMQAMTTAPSPARSVVLFFDDVNTDKADLGNARIAALRFIHEALAPNDRVAVFTASAQPGLDFTHDAGKLAAAIDAIAPHPRQPPTGLAICPRITPYEAYGIVNHADLGAYNAALAEKKACDVQLGMVVTDGSQGYERGNSAMPGTTDDSEQVMAQAAGTWEQARVTSQNTLTALRDVVDLLAREPGERMVLLASGGFLGLGPILGAGREAVADDALHAGVVINALDARGLYSAAPGREITFSQELPELPIPTMIYEEESRLTAVQAAQEPMATLAATTGGLYFHDNNDLNLGFDRLGMVPAVEYSLAFSTNGVAHNGKYHKLKVELVRPAHDLIQARPGYFAPAPEIAAGASAPAAADPLPDRMDAAMRGNGPRSGVPVYATTAVTGHQIAVNLHLDTSSLAMPVSAGRHQQDLHFIVGLFDGRGDFVAGKRAEMNMALTDATWKRFLAEGLSAKLTLEAPAGTYRLRVVVAESSDGALYAASQPVTVP